MIENRLEFYDPLYETITFQKGFPTNKGFLRVKEDPFDPIDIIQTAEFARLAFLRQAGLAWLVFPSATHTRFGHSIGCWWLGRIAESLIRVRGRLGLENGVYSLHSWLEATKLREEFYLGLLFHDVGHGPLSHVLERNKQFVGGLKAAGLNNEEVDHEHRGAALLEGSGPIVELWRETAPYRYGKAVKTLKNTREELEKNDKVCIPSILYLITKNKKYMQQCKHEHQEFLGVVNELVSGLLDLDRLDHYARDSYFSGLRQVSINVRGFLNNLCLSYEDSEDKQTHLSLTRDGASHAASLLFGKRQILSTMFRNPRTIALHTMINWALSAHLEDLGDADRKKACLQISMMEDDQFLELIAGSLHEGCRYLCQRIRALLPYQWVGKWSNVEPGVNREGLRERLREYRSILASDNSPKVLFHYDDGFWNIGPARESRDWLDTGCLILEDTGEYLKDHPDHKDNFIHLKGADQIKYLWVFIRDESDEEAKRIRDQMNEIFGIKTRIRHE
jgi:HD superfamily phosphohydrolase